MNRNSAKQGLKKQIRAYRKLHPIRIHVADHHRADGTLGKKAPLPSDNDITFTYGKPTRLAVLCSVPVSLWPHANAFFLAYSRPSTPVGALMTDKYQREWLEQQEKKVKENSKKNVLKVSINFSRAPPLGIKPSANSVPQKKPKYPSSSPNERPGKPVKIQPIALRDPATLWKLPKFTRTPAHLDTYRRKDDPALSFEAAPEPVFRIVNDKWLGLQPRELTRPIYMQDEFNKRVERTQAGGRKKKEEEKTTEKEKDKKETGKEVRFTVQDWKSGNEKVHATTTDVSESEVKVHEPIRTMTEVHTSPAHIDATVIESHKNQPAANSKDTARKTTTMHACPTSGIATITNQTETVGGQKTITTTEIATDPVTRVSFADTYQTVPGAAPLPGERKPAAILKGTGKIDRMLPELPRKVGDYRAVEGTITV